MKVLESKLEAAEGLKISKNLLVEAYDTVKKMQAEINEVA